MLIYTRKHMQTIRIGKDVCVMVINSNKHTAQLGIDAPSTKEVVRGELSGDHEHLSVIPIRPPSPFRIEFRGEIE